MCVGLPASYPQLARLAGLRPGFEGWCDPTQCRKSAEAASEGAWMQEFALRRVDHDPEHRKWALSRGLGEPERFHVYGDRSIGVQAIALGALNQMVLGLDRSEMDRNAEGFESTDQRIGPAEGTLARGAAEFRRHHDIPRLEHRIYATTNTRNGQGTVLRFQQPARRRP